MMRKHISCLFLEICGKNCFKFFICAAQMSARAHCSPNYKVCIKESVCAIVLVKVKLSSAYSSDDAEIKIKLAMQQLHASIIFDNF